jgi:hypothetical protein
MRSKTTEVSIIYNLAAICYVSGKIHLIKCPIDTNTSLVPKSFMDNGLNFLVKLKSLAAAIMVK